MVGSTIRFNIAVDNPGNTPVQVEAFTQGDPSTNLTWGPPAIVSGTTLTPYAPSAGFKDLTLAVTSAGKYCASQTYRLGIQIQNTAAITSANTGTVTVYIHSITITPP
jgi:hypothetical protein